MEPKEKATSTTYAMKALRTHVDTLKAKGLITEEDYENLNDIIERTVQEWLKKEFGAKG